MKFSIVNIAVLAAGVLAAPQVGGGSTTTDLAVRADTSVAKRSDVSTVLSTLEKDVASSIATAKTITTQVTVAALINANVAATIVKELTSINTTLSSVVDLIGTLTISANGAIVSAAATEAETVATGIVSAASNLFAGVLDQIEELEALNEGAATLALDQITTALENLEDAAKVAALMGEMLAQVGTMLSTLTAAIIAGKIGALNLLTTTAATTAEANLKNLITTISSLMSVLIGGVSSST